MKSKQALTQREILAMLQKHHDALRKYNVKKIGLFGSYALGKQRKRSDIDFLVEFKDPSLGNFIGVANYLERLFGRKIDMLTPEGVASIRIKEVAESIKKKVVYA